MASTCARLDIVCAWCVPDCSNLLSGQWEAARLNVADFESEQVVCCQDKATRQPSTFLFPSTAMWEEATSEAHQIR